MADKLKFTLALLLLAAGVAGFYFLREQPMRLVEERPFQAVVLAGHQLPSNTGLRFAAKAS